MESLSGRAEEKLQALFAERGLSASMFDGGISILMLFDCRANSSLLNCSLCTQEKQRRVYFFFPPLVLLIQDRTEGVCRHL